MSDRIDALYEAAQKAVTAWEEGERDFEGGGVTDTRNATRPYEDMVWFIDGARPRFALLWIVPPRADRSVNQINTEDER